MSIRRILPAIAVAVFVAAAAAAEEYPLGPDSQPQDVPHGVVTKYTWKSEIFPGTVRDYWVYVPAQYTPDKPACTMIFQDGGGYVNEKGRWRIPVIFDNLIHDGSMPVTVGIFINPGYLPPAGANQPGRPNRSFEYDAVSDRYARFLIEEILPEVGKQVNLSKDPNDRALSGASSGGICAFTAAWYRPDAFRRVLSFIGSYSNLRGGDAYPSIIRKAETRPLRVFLQSGKRDMNTYAGSWYIENQAMMASFEYMGYDAKLVLGEEGHNDLQGGAILPDAMRWLWREYPKPIASPLPPDSREWATNVVIPGKGWEATGEGIQAARGLAADRQGNLFVADGKRIVRLDGEGKTVVFKELAGTAGNLALAPDGRIYACMTQPNQIAAYAADGAESVIATGGQPLDLVVDKQGCVYFTDAADHHVWRVDAKGAKRVVSEAVAAPAGVRFLPGDSLLAVADASGRWAWSFQKQADGSLANPQAFYRLETPDQSSAIGAASVVVDSEGFVYVATDIGVQVCDQEGRTAFVMANPPAGRIASLAFAGRDLQTLYGVADGKLFFRPVKRKGLSLPSLEGKP